MITQMYEVYGCVGEREIFLGASDMLQIATVTANNNLGSARYMKVVIYEVAKDDDVTTKREQIQIMTA